MGILGYVLYGINISRKVYRFFVGNFVMFKQKEKEDQRDG